MYLATGPLALLAQRLTEKQRLDAHGDIIVAAGGRRTACTADLLKVLAGHKSGDTLHLSVIRFVGGVPTSLDVPLTLAEPRGQLPSGTR
jgi:S1-C subfamily serine protease